MRALGRIDRKLVHGRLVDHWGDRKVARDLHGLGGGEAGVLGELSLEGLVQVLSHLAELADGTHDLSISAGLLHQLALRGGGADDDSVLDGLASGVSDDSSGGEGVGLALRDLSEVVDHIFIIDVDCGCRDSEEGSGVEDRSHL